MPAISRRSLLTRARIRRRSVSILVSPGPRVPMPPPPATRPPACRDSDSPQPRSRGSMYCIWASSTWALPSRLLACWAKMSRISAVRSTTLTLSDLLQLAELAGGQLAVADHGVGAGGGDDVADLGGLARADVGGRVGLVAALASPPRAPAEPAVSASAASSASERSASAAVPSVQTPTSTTRSSRSCRYSTSVTSASSVESPATRRSAAGPPGRRSATTARRVGSYGSAGGLGLVRLGLVRLDARRGIVKWLGHRPPMVARVAGRSTAFTPAGRPRCSPTNSDQARPPSARSRNSSTRSNIRSGELVVLGRA